QTGGFGDPNGIPGKGDPNKATNVNRLGCRHCQADRDMETEQAATKESAARSQARDSEMASRILLQAAPSAARCKPPGSRIRRSQPKRRRRRRQTVKAPQHLLTSWTNHVRSTPRKG